VGTEAGGTIGGKLYTTSGFNKVGVYDPATNQWTIKTTASQVDPVDAGATLAAKLYVFGKPKRNPDGTYRAGTTNVYDPASNAWTSKAPVPRVQFDLAASRVLLNGKARIEVVGGARPGNNLAFIP
jgi:phage baseplate assembly protein gpV